MGGRRARWKERDRLGGEGGGRVGGDNRTGSEVGGGWRGRVVEWGMRGAGGGIVNDMGRSGKGGELLSLSGEGVRDRGIMCKGGVQGEGRRGGEGE